MKSKDSLSPLRLWHGHTDTSTRIASFHTFSFFCYQNSDSKNGYVLENAKIAAEYLNIISRAPSVGREQGRIKELEERLAKLEAVYTERLTLKDE